MSTYHADNVPAAVRTSADGQTVYFGLLVDGVFIPFHWAQIGGFRDDMNTADEDVAKYAPGPAPAAPPAASEPPA